jgi:hypothetical protein
MVPSTLLNASVEVARAIVSMHTILRTDPVIVSNLDDRAISVGRLAQRFFRRWSAHATLTKGIQVKPSVTAVVQRCASDSVRPHSSRRPRLTERPVQNVERALREHGLEYPVELDSDFVAWNGYGNQCWPTMYFIDRAGQIRYTRIGEASYGRAETAIGALLAEGAGLVQTRQSAGWAAWRSHSSAHV